MIHYFYYNLFIYYLLFLQFLEEKNGFKWGINYYRFAFQYYLAQPDSPLRPSFPFPPSLSKQTNK